MTATLPEAKERTVPEQRDGRPKLLSKEQLLNPVLRTQEAEIPGLGRVKIRELTQYEREEVEAPVMRQEADDKTGRITVRRDDRGSKARALAFALLNADGTQMFAEPLTEGVAIVNSWPTRWVDPAFDVLDDLSVLTRGAREKMGKASGKTGGDDS